MDEELRDENKDNTLEKISRREFIRRAVFGVVRAGGWGLLQYKITRGQCSQGINRAEREKNTLQVKNFAEDIVSRIKKEMMYTSKKVDFLLFTLGFFIGDAGGGYLARNYSPIQKRFIALAAGTIGSVIDAESTYLFAKYFDDERFWEYGFNLFVCEANPGVEAHPSPRGLYGLMAIRTALWAPLSFTFPFLGRGYFGASPFIAMGNAQTGPAIKYCIDLGDKVKLMIENRKSEQEIKQYIKNYKF